jgi:NAD(P)-dependent dehydrogenase (short-subunit alcohol dehydrogenase family)
MSTYSQIEEYHTGVPEDIANAVLFLASDESKFVNGDVITVGAGWTVR